MEFVAALEDFKTAVHALRWVLVVVLCALFVTWGLMGYGYYRRHRANQYRGR